MTTTWNDAAEFMDLFEERRAADRLEPCQHGHLECSTRHGGPCVDEVLHQHPELIARVG
jgi:hypothetical protein